MSHTEEQKDLFARLLATATALQNGKIEDTDTISTTENVYLTEAKAAFADHIASPRPGNDRNGRWGRQWQRIAKSLRDDVEYYEAKAAK